MVVDDDGDRHRVACPHRHAGKSSPQNRLDLRQLIGAPVVLVTRRSATTSQARCGYTPVSHMTGRRVRMFPWDPLWRLRHVGYPVSPRGYQGLPAFASLSMAGRGSPLGRLFALLQVLSTRSPCTPGRTGWGSPPCQQPPSSRPWWSCAVARRRSRRRQSGRCRRCPSAARDRRADGGRAFR